MFSDEYSQPLIGADDMMDEAMWTNVQDPVRQMFLTMTKAIRTQSAGLRDLDRKIGYLISRDSAEKLVIESTSKCCSKSDAAEIMIHVESKAHHSSNLVATVDEKLSRVRYHHSYFYKYFSRSIL